MSDQEKSKDDTTTGAASVVMVELTRDSRPQSFRSNDPQLDSLPTLKKNRSKAPSIPPFDDEINPIPDPAPEVSVIDGKTMESAASSDKQKTLAVKTLSKVHNQPEALESIELDIKQNPASPIPKQQSATAARALQGKTDSDSITDEVPELRNSPLAKNHSEWSDEEEAGGLPRSESRASHASRASRASRVSRAVRQLLCCGVPYETANEDNVSNDRDYMHAT